MGNRAEKELIFATHNDHKAQEVREILSQDWLHIKTLKEISFNEEIEETGMTLEENASIKSWAIHKAIGGNVFSDDSGLEVMSLGMAPGVHTARYAGEGRDSLQNMKKLLTELKPGLDRSARFRAVVSLIWEGKEYQYEGYVNGTISLQMSGTEGFGYDPVFIPYGYDKTFSELPSTIKNSISHRYRSVFQMRRFLEQC